MTEAAASESQSQSLRSRLRAIARAAFFWGGEISRLEYLASGVLLFLIKFALDHAVVSAAFDKDWTLIDYLSPAQGLRHLALRQGPLGGEGVAYYATMLCIALPFIWMGLGLTIARLRSFGAELWLSLFFFPPLINLLFFALLGVIAPEPANAARLEVAALARSRWRAALFSLAVTAALGVALVGVSVGIFGSYGWTLFIALPFCLGLTASLFYGAGESRTLGESLSIGVAPLGLIAAILLALAWEGAICLAMAAPPALLLAAMGAALGHIIQKGSYVPRATSLFPLMLAMPAMMGAEAASDPRPDLIAVRTSILVHAPPERVWNYVISFSELPPPTELIFRAGIAYPLRATINGRGPGAIRRCEFSTGAFVEPIEIWDKPKVLEFGVLDQPPPMIELSPYKEVHPPHLDGFFISRRGRFDLSEPAPGITLLLGTTWYENRMWPQAYWRLWSDAILHRIHLRVLRHIKGLAEKPSA